MAQKDDMHTQTGKRGEGRSARKSASAQTKAELTRILRIAYGPEPAEQVPARMMDLLDQLEAAQQRLQDERAKNKAAPEDKS